VFTNTNKDLFRFVSNDEATVTKMKHDIGYKANDILNDVEQYFIFYIHVKRLRQQCPSLMVANEMGVTVQHRLLIFS
jgi:hypothetical protein